MVFLEHQAALPRGAGAPAKKLGGKSASTYYRKRGLGARLPRIPQRLAEGPWKNPISQPSQRVITLKFESGGGRENGCKGGSGQACEGRAAAGCACSRWSGERGPGARASPRQPSIKGGCDMPSRPLPPPRARRPSPPACRRRSLMAARPPARPGSHRPPAAGSSHTRSPRSGG